MRKKIQKTRSTCAADQPRVVLEWHNPEDDRVYRLVGTHHSTYIVEEQRIDAMGNAFWWKIAGFNQNLMGEESARWYWMFREMEKLMVAVLNRSAKGEEKE